MVKTAREIMHQHTLVPEDMSIREVAELMSRKKIGSVLVESGKGLGILSERDIVVKTIVEGKDPRKAKAGEIMTFPVATIAPDVDLYQVSAIFSENDFRRLPVVERGKVIGILTTRDVAKQFIPQFFKETYHFRDFRF
jgi:CBS domain-containing protein